MRRKLVCRSSGDSKPVPHEQAAIFAENERIANAAGLRECEARSNLRGIITNPEEPENPGGATRQPFSQEMSG